MLERELVKQNIGVEGKTGKYHEYKIDPDQAGNRNVTKAKKGFRVRLQKHLITFYY